MAFVFLVLALVVVSAIATGIAYLPIVRAMQERQRIEQEARFTQWRLQQVTAAAMQQMLDNARGQR